MIYVGIVSFNSKHDILPCLLSVFKQTSGPMKVIVYDNNSNDGIRSYLHNNFPQVSYIQGEENIGFGRAHNKIIQSCHIKRGDWYLSLNPDVILHRDYIKNIVASSRTHKIDWATGSLLLLNKNNNKTNVIYSVGHAMRKDGFCINIGYGTRNRTVHARTEEVFGAPGAAALYGHSIVRGLLKQGEFYDSCMFMYAEDVDVDWRARLLGLRCFHVSSSLAYHRGGATTYLLRAHSVVNRYLSVIKNSFLFDLIFFNISIICLHFIFRLITSPSTGFWMLKKFFARLPGTIRKRQQTMVSRNYMSGWFEWALQQRSLSPSGLFDRLKYYFQKT